MYVSSDEVHSASMLIHHIHGVPFPIHTLIHSVCWVQVQWMPIMHIHGGSTAKGPMETWIGTVRERRWFF